MPIDRTVGPAALGLLCLIGGVLAVVYLIAPLMLFGIYTRLGRLIDGQEQVNRQLARLGRTPLIPNPPTGAGR